MSANLIEKLAGIFSRDATRRIAPREKLFIEKRPDLVYAIGDVHGCYDLLIDLEKQIIADAARSPGTKLIIMLGDYIDRNAHSFQVIEHLIGAPPTGIERICLAGNHEQMMMGFVEAPHEFADWLSYGGEETLVSYGLSRDAFDHKNLKSKKLTYALTHHIPQSHVEFLRNLPSLVAMPHFVFAHAGLRSKVSLQDQSEQDLLWIREGFLTEKTLVFPDLAAFGLENNLTVVHGHTPTSEPVETNTRIGVDTGAYATNILTAVRINLNNSISFLSAS